MATLHVNGTTLACVERGAGDPVVFVHGSASDYRTWQRQLEELGHGYRAIAYSRRHHWPNEPIREGADYAMDEQVEDLLPHARRIEIPGASHIAHEDNPPAFNAAVASFLASHRAADPVDAAPRGGAPT